MRVKDILPYIKNKRWLFIVGGGINGELKRLQYLPGT